MNPPDRTIVVCGATGKQGGAVLDSLVGQEGWNLLALSRDPTSPRAAAIEERGVEVRRADLLDRASVSRAFEGAHGVFAVTTPMSPSGKLDVVREREQGLNIADACSTNGVAHLVLSTVLYLGEEGLAVPYVQSKQDIERYVIDRSIPHTFLRPGSFMDEIGGEFLPVKDGVLTGQASDDVKIPYIACKDIGVFARLSFDHPTRFVGRRLNLVTDFISGQELAEILSRVGGGRRFRHRAPPLWLMWLFAREWISLRRLFESWGRPPYPQGMIEALEESRRLCPGYLDFESYLRETGFGRPSRGL